MNEVNGIITIHNYIKMRILLVYLTLPPPDLPKSVLSFGNLDREVKFR